MSPQFPVLSLYSVDGELNVKVTDNALSRDLFPDDYIRFGDGDLRPVKWAAFETLTERKCTYETDIVSIFSPHI